MSHLAMGSSTLRSKPTIHNGALNNLYRSQQPDRSKTSSTRDSYAVSDRTTSDDRPRSPVSPMESNGETWNYPSRARAHLEGLGTLYEVPLDEAPKDLFRSRPISYYDGLPTSPEPDGKAVFAEIPAAPAKNRLSRPFEQPHPVSLTPGKEKTSAPPVANLSRADPHLRTPPVPFSKRKAAPAPISIPTPVHQSRRQREPSPYQEDQAPSQRSARQQTNKTASQRPARHQGWNPFEEPPRQQRAARAHNQDRHRDDLEWAAGLTYSKNRSKHNDPQYESGRRCFFFLVIMIIIVIVVIVVAVERNKHQE